MTTPTLVGWAGTPLTRTSIGAGDENRTRVLALAERYGDEFAEVLGSSLSDGKGSRRLFFNVAQEGMVARLEEAGIVGRLAPPLQRARASVATILVGVLGSLGSAAVLTRYAKGWQRNPALESLTRAGCCWLVMSSSARCLRSVRSL